MRNVMMFRSRVLTYVTSLAMAHTSLMPMLTVGSSLSFS